MTDYPRDLVGYASRPPEVRWPDGARIAVSIVLNYEEGGENCVLHGDAHSEYVLTDVGGEPLANARNLNVESLFEYGSRVGFWEIMRILRERRVDATIYAVGMALERNPAAAAHMAESGFEVACHGQRWIDYQSVPEAAERADMLRNIEVITRLIGRRPLGWYTGRPGPNTRRLVVETGGFLYDSDAYNDDLPYWTRVAGRPHLVVPYCFRQQRQPAAARRRLRRRRRFLRLLPRCLRLAVPIGRRRPAAHDDHRLARAHHRPSRPDRCAGAPARSHPASRSGSVAVPPQQHRAPLDGASSGALTPRARIFAQVFTRCVSCRHRRG